MRELPEWHMAYEYKGYQCLIRRVPSMGHLCGYTGLKGNDLISEEEAMQDIDVHGGITYYSSMGGQKGLILQIFEGYTHVLGFDCGHLGDQMPLMPQLGGEKRDVAFVKEEIASMVDQIIEKRGN